jgi:hypothetical protein
MACGGVLQIKIGSDNQFQINLSSEYLSWIFTMPSMTTPPVAGDVYYSDGAVFRITSVNGTTVRAFSDVLLGYESEVAATGDLARSIGSGDTTLTYTARSTNVVTSNGKTTSPLDATGHTITDIKFKSSPDAETALLTLADISTWLVETQGKASVTVTAAQTADIADYKSLYFTFAVTGPVYRPQEIWEMINVQTSSDK